MLQLQDTIYPHRVINILYSGLAVDKAKYAMILIHGIGANAASMMSLLNELKADDFIYIIPQANDNTWYPYSFIERREVNEPGITSGLILIKSIITELNRNYIPNENIFLLGFSQGACLALDYAARQPSRYGGVFALSGGLIGDVLNKEDYSGNLKKTPVFLGCSDFDAHIPEGRVHETAAIIEQLNADITYKIYPGLGHTVNMDEIDFIRKIINRKKKV